MNQCRTARSLFLCAVFLAVGECQTSVDLRTQSKSVDFSAASSTKPMQAGSSLPATCALGQFFFLTTAAAGSNVYACNPANTWVAEGNSLSVSPGSANDMLSNNGSTTVWTPLSGDISGPPGTVTVSRLQGRNVSSTAPSGGQVLQWNAAANQWQPAAAQAGNTSYAFTSQTSITIPGTVHQFGTANLIVNCYDNSSPPQNVEPDKIQINPATYDVTVTFSTAQSGYCVVNGAGTAAVGGGGGLISSVFGRTGAVTAQTGDYSFAQISGMAGAGQLPGAGGDLSGTLTSATVAAIQNRSVAATAPADGQALVWNAASSTWQPGTVSGSGAVTSVFGRAGAVTAQYGDYSFGQIAGTIGSSQFPNAGGDLSGNLTAATVTGIQNRPVSSVAPLNGQALVWNSSAATWQPSTASGSGGGVSMSYQLGDLSAVRTSSTVLTIGSSCAPASPCNVRFGYQVYSITNSATATISGSGTGTAYIYVNGAGSLVVGHNLTVTCSAGCTQQTGIASFPPNVIPIYSWTATNGTWDSTGGRDQRSFLSNKTLAGGQGIVITEAPGQSTVAVDNGVIPTYLMNTASLDFPSIAPGACAADQTMTVAGANPGDAVAPGWPSLPAGVFGIMMVTSTNTVTVRICNLSGAAVDPPAATYRATVVRNY